jgi:hypothetical protein
MKTIIKIVVTLFILTACFNASRVAINNYAFEDAVHEGLLFDQRATDAQIVDMVMKLAKDYIIPMDAENIKIRQVGQDVIVDMSYTVNVELVPGILQRPWTFNPSTSTKMLVGGRRTQ